MKRVVLSPGNVHNSQHVDIITCTNVPRLPGHLTTLPSNTVDFSQLPAFKRTIKCVDFSDFLNFTYM